MGITLIDYMTHYQEELNSLADSIQDSIEAGKLPKNMASFRNHLIDELEEILNALDDDSEQDEEFDEEEDEDD